MGSALVIPAKSASSFFQPPNKVDLKSLKREAEDLLRLLRGRLEQGERTLLPARVGSQLRWYGLAQTSREIRMLFEECRVWLGPPLGSDPAYVFLDSRDSLDRRAAKLSKDGSALRIDFTIQSSEDTQRIRRQVHLLTDLWLRAPDRGIDLPRPTGRVLRQFYEALEAEDRTSAERTLQELRVRALLSASNLRFLRVNLLGELGTSNELLRDPQVKELQGVSRPSRINRYLAHALDDAVICKRWAERQSVRQIALAVEECWPRAVTAVSPVTSYAEARCLALWELLVAEPCSAIVDYLKDAWSNDPVVAATLDDLGSLAGISECGTALDLFESGDFAGALDLIETESLDVQLASISLVAAVNLGDVISASRAIRLVEILHQDARARLLASAVSRNCYDQLKERIDGIKIPTGWLSWLEGDWPDRPDLLREWCENWDRANLGGTKAINRVTATLLDALTDERRDRVRNGFPVLVAWLRGDKGFEPDVVPIAVTVLDVILATQPGRLERTACLRLLKDILDAGECSAEQYSAVLRVLTDDVGRLVTSDAVWIAGVMEALLASTVLDTGGFSTFCATALRVVLSWGDRIDRVDGSTLQHLFADAGFSYPFPQRSESRN